MAKLVKGCSGGVRHHRHLRFVSFDPFECFVEGLRNQRT